MLGAAGALPGAQSSGALPAAIVFGPVLALAALTAFKLNGTPWLLVSFAAGAVVFGLVAWLERAEREKAGAPLAALPGLRADSGLVAALLVLGGAVVAFRGLHGFGLGLLLLGGLAVLAAAPADGERSLLRGSVAFGVLVLLYRVFAESSDYRKSFEPDFLYYYVGLVAGAFVPQLLAASADRWMESAPAAADRRPVSALFRVLLAGAAAAAAPLAIWLLVGERPQAAFLVGLAVGAGFLLGARGALRNADAAAGVTGGDGGAERALARLLPVAMALAAIQLTDLLEPLSLRSRWERIGILAVVGVVVLLGVLGTALRERRKIGD
jgi:hypothetical protein